MILTTNQLHHEQQQDLKKLSIACKTVDGSSIPVYPHLLSQHRQRPCNLMLYKNEQLIGFISLFFFYESACEIALMIAPDHRRKGLATSLFTAILPLIQSEKNIDTLIFSATPDSHWLTQHGLQYQQSEFEMVRKSRHEIILNRNQVTFRQALDSDIPFLCAIDAACFPENHEPMKTRYLALLQNKEYHLVIACLNNIPIGKAHIQWLQKGTRLSDIAVLPDYQKKKLGHELISYCINQALKQAKTPVFLDVHTKNTNAIKLYTRLQFKTINVRDYWTLPLTKAVLCATT